MRIQLIDSQAALEGAVRALSGAPVLFLDTEFESNREGTELCLVQISRGADLYLIDTLRISDLVPLAPVLASAEWVLHAGQQDVPLLTRRVKLEHDPSVFDTQIAWGLTSVEQSVSLSYVKYKLLGIKAAKSHQTDDWKRRPLPESQLAYAASDIEHLPKIFVELEQRAREVGRAEMIREASRENIWPEALPSARLSLESFRNAWQLDPERQAALRYLIDWYNELTPAQRALVPDNKTLLAIASRLPDTLEDLGRIKGVSKRFQFDLGRPLPQSLKRAAAAAKSEDFVPIEPAPYATVEEIRVEGWLSAARAEVCTELRVAPELALPARVLKLLRERILDNRELRGALDGLPTWRKTLLEAPLLRFQARYPLPHLV